MKATTKAGASLHDVILSAASTEALAGGVKQGRDGLLQQMAKGIADCSTLEGAQGLLAAAEEWYKTSPAASSARKAAGIAGVGKTGKILIPGPWRTAKSRILKIYRVQGREALAQAANSGTPYASLIAEHKAAVAKDAPARDLAAAKNGRPEAVAARRCRDLLAGIAGDVTDARKGGFTDMLESCADSLSTVAANLHEALKAKAEAQSQGSKKLPQAQAAPQPAKAASA